MVQHTAGINALPAGNDSFTSDDLVSDYNKKWENLLNDLAGLEVEHFPLPGLLHVFDLLGLQDFNVLGGKQLHKKVSESHVLK